MPKKLTYQIVKDNLNKKNYTLLSKSYSNNKTLLDLICGVCKKEFKQTYDRIQRGHGHEQCGKRKVAKKIKTYYQYKCGFCKKKISCFRKKRVFCSTKCKGKYQKNDPQHGIRISKAMRVSNVKHMVVEAKTKCYFQICVNYSMGNMILWKTAKYSKDGMQM